MSERIHLGCILSSTLYRSWLLCCCCFSHSFSSENLKTIHPRLIVLGHFAYCSLIISTHLLVLAVPGFSELLSAPSQYSNIAVTGVLYHMSYIALLCHAEAVAHLSVPSSCKLSATSSISLLSTLTLLFTFLLYCTTFWCIATSVSFI